jgi:hypothetical protein
MTCKIACTLEAQQSVPKPTKADAVKVVKIVSTDKAKLATYCKLATIGDEIKKASDARNRSKFDQLSKQAADLEKTIGPEFARLNAGLDQVNPESKEGKELSAELEKLDTFCPSR